jgi:DNA (cytosine-5)-methyltransferase 1
MGGMDIGFAEQVVVRQESVPADLVQTTHVLPGFVSLKRLPFTVVFQNDILGCAAAIAQKNGWAHNYQLTDVRDLLKNNYPFPAADVVTGGFPCQDFSHAGKRKGLETERGTLYQSFVEVVKRVRPVVFVAENVEGLLTMPGAPIQKIVADFGAAGYEVTYQLIKCEEYGIPQTRHRVILLGVRLDRRAALGADWHVIRAEKRRVPCGPYFAHLAEPADTLDPAQRVYSAAAKLAKGQGQKEVVLTELGPTMRAEHHGNIEFRRITGGKNEPGMPERRLTVREAALLQTFPPDCDLMPTGRLTMTGYKPIGNAVPPLLGYLVARKVQEILDLCGGGQGSQ